MLLISLSLALLARSATSSSQPTTLFNSAAVDARGNTHRVYCDPSTHQFFYDLVPPGQGASATQPRILLDPQHEGVVGGERGPKIAIGSHNRVYVLWQKKASLVCMRSTGYGPATRFESVNVLDAKTSVDVPNLSGDPAGRIYAIWVDHRHKTQDPLGAELYMAVSRDDGSFGPNVRVSDERYPVCPCCMPES